MNHVTFSPCTVRFAAQNNQQSILDKLRQQAAKADAATLKRESKIAELANARSEEIMDAMISAHPDTAFSAAAASLILDKLGVKEPGFHGQFHPQSAKYHMLLLREKLEAYQNPKAAASVPNWLVDSLITQMENVPVDARDLDHYQGPVFSPPAESSFLNQVMYTATSVPFLVDVLDYETTNGRSESTFAQKAQSKLTEIAKKGCVPYSLSKEQKDFEPFPASTIANLLEQKGFFKKGKAVSPALMQAIQENFH